ncbi:MAG: DUF1524 domain-containing protein [Methylococcales bacterium]|nr:DUF1524 domain-containing protein [Methylococcales bacterium]
MLTIFDIRIDSESYRASFEQNNFGGLDLFYSQNIIANPELTLNYNRDDWGDWIDENNDCQNTRNEVLATFNEITPNNCTVLTGQWFGPYTQKVFFNASDIDIDHIVPVSYAHNHGGAYWSKELKQQFYNDQENLLAVSKLANTSKGNKPPTEWMPANGNYACQYVDTFLYIVDKYHLNLLNEERNTITSQCTN